MNLYGTRLKVLRRRELLSTHALSQMFFSHFTRITFSTTTCLKTDLFLSLKSHRNRFKITQFSKQTIHSSNLKTFMQNFVLDIVCLIPIWEFKRYRTEKKKVRHFLLRFSFFDRNSSARIRMALKRHIVLYRLMG